MGGRLKGRKVCWEGEREFEGRKARRASLGQNFETRGPRDSLVDVLREKLPLKIQSAQKEMIERVEELVGILSRESAWRSRAER